MRLLAARNETALFLKSGLFAACGLAVLSLGAHAQSVPETLRINVDPPEPGIRSITVDKKYRAIISRDDKGVVIDTMGSDNTLPPCDVKLEVTLENSRVLHRDANLCSGGTLVVDVSSDGKPGAAARVVGTEAGVAAGPSSSAPAQTRPAELPKPASEPTETAKEATKTSPSVVEVKPPEDPGSLKPLEQVNTPISTPGPNTAVTGAASGPGTGQARLVAPSDSRSWVTDPGNQAGSLSLIQHAVPQTDDRDFRADCTTQSGFARILFQQAPAALQEGMPQTVQITAGTYAATFNAFGSSSANEAGVSLPEVNVEMTDPLWEAMIRESELSISVEGLPPYSVSLKGSANPVRLFVATCALPQQIVGEEGLGGTGEDPGSDLSCAELGRVRSIEAVQPGQIVFRNSSQEPIEVHWVDYRGGERPYARLEPGQILEQQTYVSHAWTVRGANGQCRGIYVTQSPYREVVITGGGAGGFAPQGGFPGGAQNGVFPGNNQGSFQGGDQFNQGGQGGPVPPGSVGGGGQPAVQQRNAQASVADYLCTAGIDLNVVFSPDGQSATVAEMGYGTVTLQRLGSPNTFHYEAQGHVLKGQIQNATWSRPGLRDVFCARR